MSATKILDELPKLSPDEIDTIYFRAAALRQHAVAASPELLAAIDEADVTFEKEGGISIEDLEKTVKSWTIPQSSAESPNATSPISIDSSRGTIQKPPRPSFKS